VKFGFDLGNITRKRLDGSDDLLHGLTLTQGDKFMNRVAEAKTVGGALCAQQLYFSGSEVGS